MKRLICIGCLLATMVACDESSSSSSSQGGGLAETPQSLLGRSAATGRDLAQNIEQRDAAMSGLAEDVSGGGNMVSVGSLRFPIPRGWQVMEPSNSMRLAEMQVGSILVTFSQAGGSVDDNIARWGTQVKDDNGGPSRPKVQRETISGRTVHLVSIDGTYMEGGMFGGQATARPDYGFRAAIIEGGGQMTFVKLVGPIDEVERQEDAWEDLIFGMQAG
ncbi:MAG: hypothetical protein KDA28_12110 [Phycisphaerales bacterium]|nr:hypothetical protein [Phycisphaerales bacterium]